MNEEPVNQETNRNPDGTFKQGVSGNPNGRPPGKSLKEYDRERFAKMSDEDKEKFLSTLNPIDRYKMAEGNPANATDITTQGKPIIELAKEIIEKNEIITDDSNKSSESNSEGQTQV